MPVSYFSPSTAALPAASLTPFFLRPAVLEIQRAIHLGLDFFLQSLLINERTIAAELGRQAQQQFHQANGALELIGIDGAPVLIRLMQSLLSQHIEALPTPASEACISALRTGSQTVVAYLDAWVSDPTVLPVALLACYRSLHALQSDAPADPAALLSLHVVNAMTPLWLGSAEESAEESTLDGLAYSRAQFDLALLTLLRSSDAAGRQMPAEEMAAMIGRVAQHQTDPVQRLHWQVLQAFAELVAVDTGLEAGAVKKIFADIARLMRHLDDPQPTSLPPALVREALYALSRARTSTALSNWIADVFRLGLQLSEDGQAESSGFVAQHGGVIISALRAQLSELMAALEESAESTSVTSATYGSPAQGSPTPVVTLLGAIAANLGSLPLLSAALQRLRVMLSDSMITAQDTEQLAAWVMLMQQGTDTTVPAHVWLANTAPRLACALDAVRHPGHAYFSLAHEAAALQKQSIMAALSSAATHLLSRVESKIDEGWQSGTLAAEGPAIDAALAQLAAALAIAGATEAEKLLCEVRTLLAQYSVLPATDIGTDSGSRLANQFALLTAHCVLIDWVPVIIEFSPTSWGDADVLSSAEEADEIVGQAADIVDAVPASDAMSAWDSVQFTQIILASQHAPEDHPMVDDADSLRASPTLHAIYLDEVTQLVGQLDVLVQRWSEAPEAGLPVAAANAAHSLAGSSATVGIHAVQELAAALELSLQAAGLAEDSLVSVISCAPLHDAVAGLAQMLAALREHKQPLAQPDLIRALNHLSRQLRELRPTALTADRAVTVADTVIDAVTDQVTDETADEITDQVADDIADEIADNSAPTQASIEAHAPAGTINAQVMPQPCVTPREAIAPAVQTNSDEAELLGIFIEEASEMMPQLEQQIQLWQARPDHPAPAAALLRLLHTLKGSARMAGATALGQQLHDMEHAVGLLARSDALAPAALDALLVGFDQAMRLFTALSPADEVVPAVEAAAALPDSVRPANAAAAPLHLRVRADLLDRVTSSAAELVVGGARIQGELQQQRQAITDLNDNLGRLRTQLRELEIQAETQIASQLHLTANAEFDPLEFDRFTRLQELTRMMAESVGDVVSVQRALGRHIDGAVLAISAQSRHARSLQTDLRRLRVVQFSSITGGLHHLVRQVAGELGRQVRLEITGGAGELDRGMLEKMRAPLEHMLRNAIGHGIELPAQREAAGKPVQGSLRISLVQQANDIVVQVSDDGRGLDLARLRTSAVAAGLLSADAALSEAELAALIFEPGLSTATEITALSGRGIGMDVVRATVLAQGGSLQVRSERGLGTTLTMILPLTLATAQVVLATVGQRQLALPSAMVQEVVQLSTDRAQLARQAGGMDWRGEQLPLHHLATLLGERLVRLSDQPATIVILRGVDRLLAVELDAIVGNREVVVKNIGPQLIRVPGIAGATILADGSIVLIVNPLSLVQSDNAKRIANNSDTASSAAARHAPETPETPEAPVIMVVDDSLTVRRVSERFLQRHHYSVVLARDGLDALEKLQTLVPAAMLLDIEMPRMDGFDLLRNLRQDERLRHVPVIMITSRTAPRHRDHALQLGASSCLGKPYRETELLALLTQFIVR